MVLDTPPNHFEFLTPSILNLFSGFGLTIPKKSSLPLNYIILEIEREFNFLRMNFPKLFVILLNNQIV